MERSHRNETDEVIVGVLKKKFKLSLMKETYFKL